MDVNSENLQMPAKKSFEQWQVKVIPFSFNDKGGVTFEKVVLLRPHVQISATNAMMLNSGFEIKRDKQCRLYLLPGENQTFKLTDIKY